MDNQDKLIIDADKKRVEALKKAIEDSINELPILTESNCTFEFQDKGDED